MKVALSPSLNLTGASLSSIDISEATNASRKKGLWSIPGQPKRYHQKVASPLQADVPMSIVRKAFFKSGLFKAQQMVGMLLK